MQIRFAALIFACLFAGLFALAYDTPAQAANTLPTKMNFQGRIANSSGNILANGTYNMRFKIWSAASGGTQQWSEDRLVSATQGVTVTNGQFSVQLGSVTSLPASVFASNSLYFEVELPTPASATTSSPVWTEGAMTPRNQLATSAYAYNSETLDGLDSAAFGQLDQNNTFTGNNTFNGSLQGGSSLTLGTAAAQGSLVLNDGNGQAGTLRVADTAGNYTYTIPVTTANDTFCLQTLANCGAGGGVSTVGALDGGTANGTGASIVGSTLYLQSASVSNAGLVNTTTQSFAGNKTFTGTVTVSGATTLDDNVTVAASKSIQFVGGATGTRPAVPAEGMVYYDTTTKQLLTYANGKWQADRSTSTVIVGTSASGGTSGAVASKGYEGADFVNTSTTNAQSTIASAIAALPSTGGTVYLMEGTYIIDTTILLPSKVTLIGAGRGTIIKLKNGINASIEALSESALNHTRITISDLSLDGNKVNNTSGTQDGINLVNNNGDTTYDVINNVTAENFRDKGASLLAHYSKITNSSFMNNGMGLMVGDNSVVSNNTVVSNTTSGIRIDNADSTIVSNNNIDTNGQYGISSIGSKDAVISNNRIQDTGGSAFNNGIFMSSSDRFTVTDNLISDISATTTNSAINISDSASDNAYLSGNTLGGGAIANSGTGTIYANQVDASGSLINRNQGGFSVGKTTAGASFDLQGAIRNAVLPTPTAPTLSTGGTAGTTTYGYSVAALDGLGETLASSETTIATGNATLTAGNYINITWPEVGGAVQYKVFRSTSGGSPATTGLIRTVAGNVVTTTDTGIAASGSVAAANTTGNVSFAGTMQGGSSLALGTAAAQGSLVLNDGNGQTGTLRMADTAGNYTYTIPVTTANDTFCLQTLANCGAGGGVASVGALNGGTANGTGATIVGSTIYLQSASASFAGLVDTTTQVFAGNKTFNGTLTVANTSSFTGTLTIGAVDTTGTLLVLDTKTDVTDPAGTPGAMYYNSNLGKFRCYQVSAWTDCIGAGGAGGGQTRKISLAPEYPGAVLNGSGSGTMTSDYDSTNVHNYYAWTGSTGAQTTYNVVTRNAIPSDYASGFGTFKLWVYNGNTSTANNNIQVSIRDADGGALCASDVSVLNTGASNTWVENSVAVSGCTFAANDIITVTVKLTSNSTYTVRIGEMSYQYVN